MNLITIVIDNLRADHVGINGNSWIRTPNLDALGKESVRFTQAFPESLPTLPVRRALHTGIRTFPFKNWIPYKEWPATPGWNPIPEDQMTMSEILQEKGYTTAYITDVYHVFKPGMNYHRGFDEWHFIRGQEYDQWRTGYTQKAPDIDTVFTEKMDRSSTTARLFPYYLRSHEHRMHESEYQAPKVFTAAARWIEENYNQNKPFFLYVESFDPHEPWDPPQYYRDMYNPGYKGKEVIQPLYTEKLDYLSDAELKHVQALYAAEVTMVDTWLGYFLNKIRQLGLMKDTIIVLLSDHGTMLGENGAMGKPAFCIYPALMDLVFFIKAPGQKPGVIDSFVYNHYYFPTVFYLLGEEIPEQAEGENLWELVEGKRERFVDYVTSVFKNWGWVRDDRYIFISRPGGSEAQLYDFAQDPTCKTNITEIEPDRAKHMHSLMLKDAGGVMPDYNVPWKYTNKWSPDKK